MSTLKKQQLADAEEKYHLLVTGQAARVIVESNGERVEFNRANKAELAAYIQDLKVELGLVKSSSRRPIGFAL